MRFKYKAIKNGRVIIKNADSESEKALVEYLRNNGYFPVWVKPAYNNDFAILSQFLNRVSFNDIVDFTRQLAIMLNAGLTLTDSLEIIKKQIKKASFQKIILEISNDIKGGNSFSSALKKYSQYFPNLYIALVKSGEASGKLAEILLKLSENLEKEREFKGKLKGALIYPVIIILAMIGVMFVMITFVIPRLLNLYKEFNIQLPLTTQILIFISSLSTRFWPVVVGSVFFGAFFLKNYLKTKSGKYYLDNLLLKIPVISNVIKISSLVNSTRTLSVLIGSGVSILDALTIVVETTDNVIFQNAFARIYKKVEKGQSLGICLDEEGIFPPILVQMTHVGEQTGHLDETLMRLSKYFEMESELAIKALTSLIEPAILVFLGLGVGFLVMSVITPIYNLTSSFK